MRYFTLPLDFSAATGEAVIPAMASFDGIRCDGRKPFKVELIGYSTYCAGIGTRLDSVLFLQLPSLRMNHMSYWGDSIPLHTHDGFADHWLSQPLELYETLTGVIPLGTCRVFDCEGNLNVNISQVNLTFRIYAENESKILG